MTTTTTLPGPGDDGDETAKIIDLGQHRPILATSETEPAGDVMVEPEVDEFDDGETFLMSGGQVIDQADLGGSSVDRQIIADWLRDRTAFAEVAADAVKRVFRSIAFHLVRLPLYWLRLTLRGWIGARRACRKANHWASDPTFDEDRETMRITGRGDINELRADHKTKVRDRVLIVGASYVTALAALAGLLLTQPAAIAVAALIIVADVLGFYGRPDATSPIIERNTYAAAVAPPFTEGLMLDALRRAGAEPNGARKIHVLQPPAKIRTGWEAIVSLGVPAETIIKAKGTFATAVDRPANCVWLTADPDESAGWLRIVITRKSLRKTRMPAWPFLHAGGINYFTDGVPVGIDETGNPVTAKKAYTSTVYGGIMGAGKTVSMINAALGLASDPRVELHIDDLKGGTDWLDFAPIAHFLRAGTEPEDEAAVLADLEDLNKRMDRRFRTLQNLPDDLRSPKTNDALANRKDLDLHPIVLIIDETQELFEFSQHKDRYEALVSRLIKKGRGVAITVEAGTQEVKKPTLPFAGLCHWRHCMAVQGHTAVDLVLGTGAYSAGLNADALTAEDRGIGFFGTGKEIGLVRSYFLDPDAGEIADVVERFRSERQALGRLSGMAAGDIDPDDDYSTFVDDLARHWPGRAAKMSHEVLAGHLAQVEPDRFGDITADMVSKRGRSHGLESVPNCKGLDGKYTRKGFAHADVLALVAEDEK